MSRGVWKIVEAKAEKFRIAKTKRGRKKERKREKMRRERAEEERKEKTKKEKNNRSKEGVREIEDLEWRWRSSKVRKRSKETSVWAVL